jgi:hypothetical protein
MSTREDKLAALAAELQALKLSGKAFERNSTAFSDQNEKDFVLSRSNTVSSAKVREGERD